MYIVFQKLETRVLRIYILELRNYVKYEYANRKTNKRTKKRKRNYTN